MRLLYQILHVIVKMGMLRARFELAWHIRPFGLKPNVYSNSTTGANYELTNMSSSYYSSWTIIFFMSTERFELSPITDHGLNVACLPIPPHGLIVPEGRLELPPFRIAFLGRGVYQFHHSGICHD